MICVAMIIREYNTTAHFFIYQIPAKLIQIENEDNSKKFLYHCPTMYASSVVQSKRIGIVPKKPKVQAA